VRIFDAQASQSLQIELVDVRVAELATALSIRPGRGINQVSQLSGWHSRELTGCRFLGP
jgi:hypothetical protein